VKQRLLKSSIGYAWEVVNLLVVVYYVMGILSSNNDVHFTKLLLAGSSALSIILQISSMNHLKGTAIPERHVVLSTHFKGHQEKLGVDRVDEEDKEEDQKNEENEEEEQEQEFVDILVEKMISAKETWDSKVAKFKANLRGDMGRPSDDTYESTLYLNLEDEEQESMFLDMEWDSEFHNDLSSPAWRDIKLVKEWFLSSSHSMMNKRKTFDEMVWERREMDAWRIAFRRMMHLYTDPNPSLFITSLERMFELHPTVIEYFLPQLAQFLVFGAFNVSIPLKESLLRNCSSSLSFSLLLHWLISSFSLEGAEVDQKGFESLRSLLQVFGKKTSLLSFC